MTPEERMDQSLGPKHSYDDPAPESAPDGFQETDMVDHPPHYTQGAIEVIEAIEDWALGFHEGNVVKYVARAQHKGKELEDLKKAAWYLQRRIEQLEGEHAG